MSGCKSGQQGTLCIQKYWCDYVLPPLLSTGHMPINADPLALDANVSYLRGTTGERVSYERSGHTQLYCDCPVKQLTFPVLRAESPSSECCPSPAPTTAIGSGAVAADVQDCPETESLNVAPQDETKHFQVALIISESPLGHHIPV